MTELQFEGLTAEGMGEDLVAEANSKNGLRADELLDLGVDVIEGRRVAGSV